MCTKEKVKTEQKTLTVFQKGCVRKNDRIRSFFNSFSRRRYAGSLTPIRTWATKYRYLQIEIVIHFKYLRMNNNIFIPTYSHCGI